MTTSLFAKLTIAAAATMITLTPALADRNDHRHNDRSHYTERSHQHYGYNHYGYNRHAYGRRHFGHRHWKPRFYGWNYGYEPYRRWW